MYALFDPFQAHSSNIMQIKQSPFNNDHVATCSKDNTVKVWSISDNAWTLLRTYDGHASEVYTLEWVNGDTLASGSNDGLYKIWSISTGRTLVSMNTNAESVSCMKLLNNGFYLAIGLSYRTYYAINIYNVNTNLLIASLRGHTDWIYDLAQIGDDLLASSSYDETIRIWNLTTNTCKYNLTGHVSRVRSIRQVSIDILLSAGGDQFDNTFKLWNISSGQVIRNFKGPYKLFCVVVVAMVSILTHMLMKNRACVQLRVRGLMVTALLAPTVLASACQLNALIFSLISVVVVVVC